MTRADDCRSFAWITKCWRLSGRPGRARFERTRLVVIDHCGDSNESVVERIPQIIHSHPNPQ